MVYINDLVQEFWRTSSDEAIGAPFFAMRRLFEILQEYLEMCNTMCSLIVSVFVTPVDLADKNLQLPNSWHHSTQHQENVPFFFGIFVSRRGVFDIFVFEKTVFQRL